jgi:hypothetical protein
MRLKLHEETRACMPLSFCQCQFPLHEETRKKQREKGKKILGHEVLKAVVKEEHQVVDVH